MRKQIILFGISILLILLFASVSIAKEISVFGSIIAYCPKKTMIAEGTFTFNPDEIIPDPADTEKRCSPVSKSSPVFGKNEEIQLGIKALKCGPYPLYYSFTIKFYSLDISYIISHKDLGKIKKFRIQLNSSQANTNLETPLGKFDVIYFEGRLLEK